MRGIRCELSFSEITFGSLRRAAPQRGKVSPDTHTNQKPPIRCPCIVKWISLVSTSKGTPRSPVQDPCSCMHPPTKNLISVRFRSKTVGARLFLAETSFSTSLHPTELYLLPVLTKTPLEAVQEAIPQRFEWRKFISWWPYCCYPPPTYRRCPKSHCFLAIFVSDVVLLDVALFLDDFCLRHGIIWELFLVDLDPEFVWTLLENGVGVWGLVKLGRLTVLDPTV